MRKRTLLVGFVVASLAFTGCGKKEDESAKATDATDALVKITAVNTICPISGDPVSDDIATVDFGKQAVGFCCDDCVEKWSNLGYEAQGEKLAEAMADH